MQPERPVQTGKAPGSVFLSTSPPDCGKAVSQEGLHDQRCFGGERQTSGRERNAALRVSPGPVGKTTRSQQRPGPAASEGLSLLVELVPVSAVGGRGREAASLPT